MLYRVRPGFAFGYAKQHPEGSLVELTEAEARGFLDKLEPVSVEDTGPATPPVTDEEPAPAPADKPEAKPEPASAKAKRKRSE